MAKLVGDEDGVMLASRDGRVIHFALDEVNILAGVGKGVIGIKLDDDDDCLGGVLVGGRFDKLVRGNRERQDAGVRPRGDQAAVSRGGKGDKPGERTKFARVVPPPIELVNWDEVEGKAKPNGRKRGTDAETRIRARMAINRVACNDCTGTRVHSTANPMSSQTTQSDDS